MATIFMSHSRNDERGRKFFDTLFAATPHEAYWYSFEGPAPPHGPSIYNAIKRESTVAMFVVLSPEMDNEHTRAWVGYEVGLATALNKYIFVFEHEDENVNVNVPVPNLSGYFLYPTKLERKDEGPFLPLITFLGDTLDDSRINALALQMKIQSKFSHYVSCYYENCKAPYTVYTKEKLTSFNCPVCRKSMKI